MEGNSYQDVGSAVALHHTNFLFKTKKNNNTIKTKPRRISIRIYKDLFILYYIKIHNYMKARRTEFTNKPSTQSLHVLLCTAIVLPDQSPSK